MSGFEADLAAIGVTAGVLGSAAESVSAAVDRLDGCSGLGPGRLDAVACQTLQPAAVACATASADGSHPISAADGHSSPTKG